MSGSLAIFCSADCYTIAYRWPPAADEYVWKRATVEGVTMPYALFAVLGLHILAAAATGSTKDCADFVAKLETCTPYKCTFVHPFTGERLEKRIVEYKGRKCKYTEQMPNGGKMECAYTDTIRKVIVKYHKDLEAANSAGKSVGTSVHGTLRGAKTRYTIDGKEVENPLQEALDNGQCKLSGYTNSPPKKK